MKKTYQDLINEGVTPVNLDDLEGYDNMPFWDRVYLIQVTAQGISFLVNAHHEDDAIDYLIDHCVEHSPGLVWSRKEETELMREGILDDYIFGGNEGRYLSTHNVHIEEVTG